VAWFRRATIGACALALASAAWTFYGVQDSAPHGAGDELTLADSAMNAALGHE
jgi:hypothetical protein